MKSKAIPLSLFGDELLTEKETEEKGKTTERLKRLDFHGESRGKVLLFCRLKYGEIWEDLGQRPSGRVKILIT